jgi:hypothetical protein
MAQQTLEVIGNYNNKDQVVPMCEVFCALLNTAVLGYSYTVDRIQTTASGRLRVTVSSEFPQAEIDSFAGAIIVV